MVKVWLLIMLSLVNSSKASLTLDLHLALVQGSPLPEQEEMYLKDSFRRKVLIPFAEERNHEIESLTAKIEKLEVLVGIMQGVNGMMILLMTLLIWTLRNGRLKTATNLEKLKEQGESIAQV